MNWELRKSAIALYLSVIKRTSNQGANKSNHPNQNPLFSSRVLPYTWQYIYLQYDKWYYQPRTTHCVTWDASFNNMSPQSSAHTTWMNSMWNTAEAACLVSFSCRSPRRPWRDPYLSNIIMFQVRWWMLSDFNSRPQDLSITKQTVSLKKCTLKVTWFIRNKCCILSIEFKHLKVKVNELTNTAQR
jgi:hypothetical protein